MTILDLDIFLHSRSARACIYNQPVINVHSDLLILNKVVRMLGSNPYLQESYLIYNHNTREHVQCSRASQPTFKNLH